ncbi:MAG: ABC transporter permease, partial [Polaromonas sp.]
MDDSPPRIEVQDTPEGRVVCLQGAWTAANLTVPAAWAALTAQLNGLRSEAGAAAASSGKAAKASKAVKTVAGRWSLAGIEKIDYLGAQVLWNQWDHQWPAALQIDPEQRAMLETVEKFTVKLAPARTSSWSEPLLVLGNRLLSLLDHMKGLL